jgi:hypothetical protein
MALALLAASTQKTEQPEKAPSKIIAKKGKPAEENIELAEAKGGPKVYDHPSLGKLTQGDEIETVKGLKAKLSYVPKDPLGSIFIRDSGGT